MDWNAAAITTLESTKPEILIILVNNAPLTGFLREYAPKTLVLPKMVISFVDREKLLADLGKDAAGVGFSVVVPEYTKEKYTVVRSFLPIAREMKIAVTPVSLSSSRKCSVSVSVCIQTTSDWLSASCLLKHCAPPIRKMLANNQINVKHFKNPIAPLSG